MKMKSKNNMFGQMAEIVNLIGKARGLALDSGFDLEVNMVVADGKAAKESVAEVELEALPKETGGRKRQVSWPAVLKRRKEIKAMMMSLIEAAGYNGISAAKLASRCRISGQKVGQNLRHLAAEPGSRIVLTKTPKGRIVSVSTINKSQV
jgi:hypothetical protein